MYSHICGIWGDPTVNNISLVSISTYKEADSKKTHKNIFEKTILYLEKLLMWQIPYQVMANQKNNKK